MHALSPSTEPFQEMTLTVIDGNFDRRKIQKKNLELVTWQMDEEDNRPEVFNLQPPGGTVRILY